MSTRRRVKPAVNLAPRRSAAVTNNKAPLSSSSAADDCNVVGATVAEVASLQPKAVINQPINSDQETTPVTNITTLSNTSPDSESNAAPTGNAADATKLVSSASTADTNPKATCEAAPQEVARTETAVKRQPARRIKPAVCLPMRKRNAAAPVVNSSETPLAVAAPGVESASNDTNDEKLCSDAIDNDDHFKSPSSGAAAVLNDIESDASDGTSKSHPISPTKRQRIRPTPCFGNRRNSLQGGNDSETSDIEVTTKRQRHTSTSSTYGSSGAIALATPPATTAGNSVVATLPLPQCPAQPIDTSAAVAPLNVAPPDNAADSALSEEAAMYPVDDADAGHPQNASVRSSSPTSPELTSQQTTPLSPASSSSSSLLPFTPPNGTGFGLGLGSNSSNKPKKSAPRSDESQRIAQAKRDFQQRFNGQQPDKARLTMFDMIFYNPTSNPMKNPAIKSSGTRSRRASNASTLSEAASAARSAVSSLRSAASGGGAVSVKSEGNGGANGERSNGSISGSARRTSTESNVSLVSRSSSSNGSMKMKDMNTASEQPPMMMPVPQLKLGPNGEIVLDEKSLVIETTGDKEARATLANAEIVYDDEFSGTSGFYKRNKRTRDWPSDETIRFYRCLHTIGTDFSMMLTMFPNRSRRDLKLKYKKEERINPSLIDKALKYPKQFDVDVLKQDFEREQQLAEQMRAQWAEEERRKREEKKACANQRPQPRPKIASLAQRTLAQSNDALIELADKVPPPKRRRTNPNLGSIIESTLAIKCEQQTATKPPIVRPPINESVIENIQSNVKNERAQQQQTENADTESQAVHILPMNVESLPNANTPNEQFVLGFPSDIVNQISDTDITLPITDANPKTRFDDQLYEPRTDNEDILNMEIVFEQDEFIINAADSISPSTATSESNTGYTYSITPISPTEEQRDATAAAEATLWSADDITINALPALPEIAKIAHNNVVLYDLSQQHQSPTFNDKASSPLSSMMPRPFKNKVEILSQDIKPAGPFSVFEPVLSLRNDELGSSRNTAAIKMDSLPRANEQLQSPPEMLLPVDLISSDIEEELCPVVGQCAESTNNNNTDTCATIKTQEVATIADVDNVEDETDDDEDDDDLAGLVDSLVVVARQDADGNVVHEVFLMSPTTGQLCDEPLDLPADVIERIKSSLVTA